MFKLEFSTGNDAFASAPAGQEMARILRSVAALAECIEGEDAYFGMTIFDANGNPVGEWSYEPAASEDGEA